MIVTSDNTDAFPVQILIAELVNYATVTRKKNPEAQNRQWRVMTLDVMLEWNACVNGCVM